MRAEIKRSLLKFIPNSTRHYGAGAVLFVFVRWTIVVPLLQLQELRNDTVLLAGAGLHESRQPLAEPLAPSAKPSSRTLGVARVCQYGCVLLTKITSVS